MTDDVLAFFQIVALSLLLPYLAKAMLLGFIKTFTPYEGKHI